MSWNAHLFFPVDLNLPIRPTPSGSIKLYSVIGQETRTGTHIHIRSGQNKEEIPIKCGWVPLLYQAPVQLFSMFHASLPYKRNVVKPAQGWTSAKWRLTQCHLWTSLGHLCFQHLQHTTEVSILGSKTHQWPTLQTFIVKRYRWLYRCPLKLTLQAIWYERASACNVWPGNVYTCDSLTGDVCVWPDISAGYRICSEWMPQFLYWLLHWSNEKQQRLQPDWWNWFNICHECE